MKITFNKRLYIIQDDKDKYEVVNIVKHPIIEYSNSYFFHEYKEYENSQLTGYFAFTPSEELKTRLIKIIESYENYKFS
jgi:hypothetical protein